MFLLGGREKPDVVPFTSKPEHIPGNSECLAPLLVQWGIHPPSSVTETARVETGVSLRPPLEHSFINADPQAFGVGHKNFNSDPHLPSPVYEQTNEAIRSKEKTVRKIFT